MGGTEFDGMYYLVCYVWLLLLDLPSINSQNFRCWEMLIKWDHVVKKKMALIKWHFSLKLWLNYFHIICSLAKRFMMDITVGPLETGVHIVLVKLFSNKKMHY